MKFYFSKREKSAIIRVAVMMEAADGKADLNETAVNLKVFQLLDADESITEAAKSLSFIDSMSILKSMTTEEKKFVCGILATIMVADKDIDDKEMTLWQTISTICEFPTMHIKDALKSFLDNCD